MRYELSDYEWAAIKPMLPNKPRVSCVQMTVACSMAFFGIKQCRRVATRYDKLSANYPAFIKLASIRIWPRANESRAWWKS
jgi:transposase